MTSNKVLFIIHDLYQEDIHFPLGPAYLAAVLRQAGAEVEIYDMQAHHYTNDELVEHLDNNEYSLINVGFLAARFDIVQPLLDVIAEHKNGAWLVLGGHAPSATPEWMLENTPADIVCFGESEETIVELYKHKTEFNPLFLSDIKGIAYKGWMYKIKSTERRKPVQDLDSIPFPAWDLFPMDKYSTALQLWGQGDGERCIGFLSSRGCIGKCNFCHRLEGHGVRYRSSKNIVDEMEILLNEYGITGYFLYDEMFVSSKARLRNIKQELEDRGMEIKFSANARVDGLTREKMEILKSLGCTFLNMGVESSSQDVLNLMEKQTNIEQNIKAIKLAKEFGINAGINMLWNNYGDTAETLQNNVNFLKKYNTDYSQLRTIRPVSCYPGTPLYYQAIQEGRLKGPGDFYERFNNSDLITVNFLKIPDKEAYKLLFDANSELIHDHQQHANTPVVEVEQLIESFRQLYFNHDYSFKGARHYDIKNM